jgi:hypothetical protein
MALSKKLAQRTIPTPKPHPDPLGIAKVVAEISPRLEEAYYAWLNALLRKFVLVGFEPAVLQRIVDAGTAQGRPVTVHVTLTIHPRDASGFARVDGALKTPAAKRRPDDPDDPEYGPSMKSLFGRGELVRARRPTRGWRNQGRAGRDL